MQGGFTPWKLANTTNQSFPSQLTTDSNSPMGKAGAAERTCVLVFARWGAGEIDRSITLGTHSASGAQCGGRVREVVERAGELASERTGALAFPTELPGS